MENLGRFTNASLRAAPAMAVRVTKGETEIRTYRAPAGFRLDQYVASKHPEAMIGATYPVREGATRPDYQVVARDEHGEEIETHTGVYDAVEV